MEHYIQKKLEHLPMHERKQAFTLLCAIGLEYIDEKFHHGDDDHPVDIMVLNRHCDRMFRNRLAQAEARAVTKARTPTQARPASKSPLRNSNVAKQVRCYHDAVKAERHSRCDSMASFPFVDDRGSVEEVLHLRPGATATGGEAADESGTSVDLCRTSLPGRMRLITKTYGEICRSGGKSGMKHADIPVALRALGVRVAPRLEQLLASGGGIHSAIKDPAAAKNAAQIPLAPSTISLVQFQEIVKKCLELDHKHRKAGNASVADLADAPKAPVCFDQLGNNFADADAALIDTILFDDADSVGAPATAGGRRGRGCAGPRDSPSKLKVRHTNTSAQRRALNSRPGSRAGDGDSPKQAAGIREQIRQDRRFFEQRRRAEEVAAERTIAEYKVDQYLGSHDNSSYSDWRKSGGNRDDGDEPAPASDYVRATHKTKLRAKSPYSLTRSSGDSAVTIAEAFLSGPVARDILRPVEEQEWDQSSSLNIRAFERAAREDEGADSDSDLGDNLEKVLNVPSGVGSWGNERYLERQRADARAVDEADAGKGKENIGLKSKAFDHSVFFIQSQAQRSAAAAALLTGRPELGVQPRTAEGSAAAAAAAEPGPVGGAAAAESRPQSANDRVSVRERIRRQEDEDAFNDILHGAASTGGKPKASAGSAGSVYADPLAPGYSSHSQTSGSKWKGTRGGWVADFGPLHTRTLAPREDPAGDSGRSRSAARQAAAASAGGPGLFTENRRRDHRAAIQKLSETKCMSAEGTDATAAVKAKARSKKDDALIDFVTKEQPVRSYAEISETFTQTGVKPWKQMSLLKKYYGDKAVFRNNEVPEPEGAGDFGTARDDYEAGKRVRALRARQAQADAEEEEEGDENSSASTVAVHDASALGAGSVLGGSLDDDSDVSADDVHVQSFNVRDNVRGSGKAPAPYRNDISGTETYKYWDAKAAPGAADQRRAADIEQILRQVGDDDGQLQDDSSSSSGSSDTSRSDDGGSVDSRAFNMDNIKLPAHLNASHGSVSGSDDNSIGHMD